MTPPLRSHVGHATIGYRGRDEGKTRQDMSRPSSLLYLSPERVLYRGPLGQPRIRTLGAAAWYVAPHRTLSLTCADGSSWHQAHALCVPAGVPHQVAVGHGHVVCYLVEQGFSDLSGVGAAGPLVAQDDGTAWARVAMLSTLDLQAWRDAQRPVDVELDHLVMGQALPARATDSRIADVVSRIRRDPALSWLAADAALHCGLSTSRFMHLFKAEVGVGWRSFRAWQRARGLLACVHTGENLTQLALSLGYPDGTHFSHAIRQITGLRPSDIISGSRHLSVWNESGVSRGAAS